MVASAKRGSSIGLGEKSAYFPRFEIAGAGGVLPLGRKRQHAVILLSAGGVAAEQMPKE